MSNPFGLVEPGTPEPDFIDHLYGFEPVEPPSWVRLYLGAHADCWISTFCRNPLHPGPCKGWKKTLAKIAPGAYNALEKDRVDKLNAKRKAKIAALKAQGKPVPPALEKEIKPVPASEAAKGAPSGTGEEAPLSEKREAKIKAVSAKVKEEFDPETVAAKKAAAAKEKKAAAAKKAAATKAANKAKKADEEKAAADAEAAAKGGMGNDEAQAYAEAMGAVVKLGIPKATKTGIKDGVAKTKKLAMDGPVADNKPVQDTIDNMAGKIANQAASGQFGSGSQAKLKEIAKQEIAEMLAAGSTEPPAGGLLEALKKYNEAPKGAAALDASDHLKEVAADIVHGPGTSTKAKKVAENYEQMAKATGSAGLASSFKNVAKSSVLANPNSAVSGGAMLQGDAADKVMKAAKAADPSLTPKQLQALGQAAKDLVAAGLKPDGSGSATPLSNMMAKDGASLAKIAKALTPDDAPTSGPDGPNGNKAKAYAVKSKILAGKAGITLSPGALKAAETAALKDLDAGITPGDPGSEYEDAMDLVASDMAVQLADKVAGGLSISEKLALSDQIAKVLRAAGKQGAPTGGASAQLNAIGKLKPGEIKAMAKAADSQSSTSEGSAAPGTESLPLPGSPEAKAKTGLAGLAKAYGDAFNGDTAKAQASIVSPTMQKAMEAQFNKGGAEAKKAAYAMAVGIAKAKVDKMAKEKGYDLTPAEQNAMATELADQMAAHIAAGNDPTQATAWQVLDGGNKAGVKLMAKNAEKAHGGAIPTPGTPPGGPSVPTPPPAPSGPSAKQAKSVAQQDSAEALWSHANGSTATKHQLINELVEAVENGDDEDVEEVQVKIADHLAAAALEDLGDIGMAPSAKQAALAKLQKDYLDALMADADEPGGLAGQLDEIAEGAKKLSEAVADGNGWDADSPSVQAYHNSVMDSGIQSQLGNTSPPKKSGNAGSGGPSPATPVTPPPAKSAPAKKVAKAAKAAPVSGTADPVSGITHPGGQIQNDPQGIYPIGQVVVSGHEQEVADYNARVEAGVQGKAAMNVPRDLASIRSQATVGNHSGIGAAAGVNRYTGDDYIPINGALRSNEASASVGTSSTARSIRAMDSAFSESHISEPITVLRGFRNPGLVFGSSWRPDSSMVGTEWRDPAYSSTTIDMATARNFAGANSGNPQNSVILRIHMPAGSAAIGLAGQGEHGHENEILLNRGARYRIVADNGYQNGARHIDVELVLDGD